MVPKKWFQLMSLLFPSSSTITGKGGERGVGGKGKIYTSDHWGLSKEGQTIIEGQPFNYYNYKGDYQHGHIPVDISREVFEAVKGMR